MYSGEPPTPPIRDVQLASCAVARLASLSAWRIAVVGRHVKYAVSASQETVTASAIAIETSAKSRALSAIDFAVWRRSAIAIAACSQVPVSRRVPPSASQKSEISLRSAGGAGSSQSASRAAEALPHVRSPTSRPQSRPAATRSSSSPQAAATSAASAASNIAAPVIAYRRPAFGVPTFCALTAPSASAARAPRGRVRERPPLVRAARVLWRTACDYLRDDVGSGYVRILWELWAAGLADPELAERWRATQPGVALPMRPRVLTALIANLFEGAETEILAGVGEDESPHLEALEALAGIIERVERG